MRFRIAGLLGCLMVLLCGCGGYRLGPTNGLAAGEKSIQVNLFQNETFEPRLTTVVDHALRKSIQRDGTYRLETQGNPDIVINGVLTEYNRTPLTFDPRDTLTVRDFTIILKAKVTAIEKSTGKVLLDREVTGRTILRMGQDLPSAERQAAPLLADDLSRNITSLLVDGTW